MLLNVLDIPGFNQDRDMVPRQFGKLVDAEASPLIPMAAMFETGDHIADLRDPRQRRRYAETFRAGIRKTLRGERPWVPIPFPDSQELAEWREGFPEYAMSGLSTTTAREAACALHQSRRVRIWSLDRRLQSHDRKPPRWTRDRK